MPTHVPPFVTGGIVLVEQVILALVEDHAIGVVHPVLLRREVILRPERLHVKALWKTCAEVNGVLKLWTQTVAAPILSSALFILVFGLSLGDRISRSTASPTTSSSSRANRDGHAQAAYANNSATVFQARFDRYLNDVLSAPMRAWEVNLGFNARRRRARAAHRRRAARDRAAAHRRAGRATRSCSSLAVSLLLVLFCSFGVIVGVYAESWDHRRSSRTS